MIGNGKAMYGMAEAKAGRKRDNLHQKYKNEEGCGLGTYISEPAPGKEGQWTSTKDQLR